MLRAAGLPIEVRGYRPDDRDGCLAVFDSNVPGFLSSTERPQLTAVLDAAPRRFLVIQRAGEGIVACGGLAREPDRATVSLCWGMVRRDRHRQGLGRLILEARLLRLHGDGSLSAVKVSTTEQARGFYERHGFLLDRVVENGLGHGIDRYDLRLAMTG